MKKRLLFAVVLAICLLNIAYALPNGPDEHPETIERYTNVMGDNVHIIRIQNISEQLGVQLDELEIKNQQLEQKINQLNSGKGGVETEQEISGLKQDIKALKTQLTDFKQGYAIASDSPAYAIPSTFFLKVLLANTAIFVFVLVGLLYVRNKPPKSQLDSYIKRNIKTLEPHEIKLNLLSKGWKINQIENAFKRVK